MSIRRMMLFSLGAKIKNLIEAFKTRVFAQQGEFEAETCLDATLTDLDNKGLLDNASLVVTPNAYEENLLFNVVPSDGKNFLLQTQNFNTSPWTKLQTPNVTVVENAAIAPDGTNTANLITSNTTTVDRGIRQAVTIEPNTNYTLSFWARSDNGAIIRADVSNQNTQQITLTSTWTRYTINGSYNQSLAYTLQWVDFAFDSNQLGKTFELWGAQLEVGTVATEYQPNTTTRGGFQVIRATTATRVNEVGEIEDVPYNLLLRSQELENSLWTKLNTTIGANVLVAPDGTFTADNVIANSGVTYNYIGASGVNVVANSFPTFLGTRTASIYLKFNGLNRIRFQYGSTTTLSSNIYVEVDLQAGIITGTRLNNGGPALASNPFIENVGDGWYRVGFNILASVSPTNNRIAVALGDSVKTVANGVDGVYVWGAQLVKGTQPKDYFPTTNRQNVPRIDYSDGSCPALLAEPQSRNEIRNNTMVGAVVGTPGTLPTNWTDSLIGMSRQVVGLGVENGVEYIDVRLSGTAAGANPTALQRILFEPATQIVAATGQTWTLSSYIKIISNPQPPVNTVLQIFETTSGGTLVSVGNQIITPTTTLQRFNYTRTISGGTTVARVQPMIDFRTLSGQTYDFTVRVGLPQMEQRPNVTSVIPTTTAAVTRNADSMRRLGSENLIGQTEGTLFVEFIPKVVNSDIIRVTEAVNTYANGIFILINAQGNLQTIIRANSLFAINNTTAVNISNTPVYKVAITYSLGSTKIFVNGILRHTNTNTYAFTSPLARVQIDDAQWTGNNQTRAIRNFALYKTALTDAQAIQLTTL